MHRSKKKTVNNIGLRDKGNGLDEEEEDIFEVEKFLDADWKVTLDLKEYIYSNIIFINRSYTYS